LSADLSPAPEPRFIMTCAVVVTVDIVVIPCRVIECE
jgi:hypothetical protein